MNTGDIVKYNGPYDNCHNVKYKIIYVYNFFGISCYDLEFLDIEKWNILSGIYKKLYSVPHNEIYL